MSERVNTRNLVVDILLSVERDGEFSHTAIRGVLDKYRYLARRDRAFIRRLAGGTIERQIELDYILNQFSRTRTERMKPVIRAILRSGVYQIFYMDAVPDAAACSEAVSLAAKRGFSGLKGFVNGVLRTVAANRGRIVWPDGEREPQKAISVRCSMPEWLTGRLLRQFGQERCRRICEAFLEERPVTVRVNTGKISVEEIQSSLKAQGVEAVRVEQFPYALRLSSYESLEDIPEFREGLFYVQDTASMAAAEAAAVKPGDFVLDVCAAPGGKSIALAWALAGTGTVEARDISEFKANLIRENIERCRVSNMRVNVWDALQFDPSMEEAADVVVADLPCSGLGVIGSKPDIKYNASEEKIRDLADLQGRILAVVCRYVKPGGTLLYSTCTVTQEENQENTKNFLQSHPQFALRSERQLLPDEGCDGFYIAVMGRKV